MISRTINITNNIIIIMVIIINCKMWSLLEAEEQASSHHINIILILHTKCNPKVWSLLEAEEDLAAIRMKEALEQLHQSEQFVFR